LHPFLGLIDWEIRVSDVSENVAELLNHPVIVFAGIMRKTNGRIVVNAAIDKGFRLHACIENHHPLLAEFLNIGD
jgi:hypothetical protein